MRIQFVALTLLLCLGARASAAEGETAPPSRLSLKSPARIEPAPQQSARYILKARLAREESAGELREGGGFALIGRFAKAGMNCDFSDIFSNGFEGN